MQEHYFQPPTHQLEPLVINPLEINKEQPMRSFSIRNRLLSLTPRLVDGAIAAADIISRIAVNLTFGGPHSEAQSPELATQSAPELPPTVEKNIVLTEKPKHVDPDLEYYCLPGTGFNVREEINMLIRALQVGIRQGKDPERIIREFIACTTDNMRHFVLEYPLQEAVFPIILAIKEEAGEMRVRAPKFANQLWVDLTSSDERKGHVKATIAAIEDRLVRLKEQKDQEEGRKVELGVFLSPPGWAWSDHDHPESQYYLVRRQGDMLQACAVRSDLTLAQTEAVFAKLRNEPYEPKRLKELTPEQRIIRVVSSPCFHTQGDSVNCFEDVLAVMQDIKRSEYAYKNKTFARVRTQVGIGDRLLELNENIQQYAQPHIDTFAKNVLAKIGRFSREQVRYDAPQEQVNISADFHEMINWLERQVGETMLHVNHSIREKTLDLSKKFTVAEYRSESIQLQAYVGCNRGGIVKHGRSLLEGSAEEEDDKAACIEIECPLCHWKPKAEDLDRLDLITKCPGRDGKACPYVPGKVDIM